MSSDNPYSTPKAASSKVSLAPAHGRHEFAMAWEIYVKNFLTIAMLVAVIGVPYNLLDSCIEYFVYPDFEDFGKGFRASFYLGLVFGVAITAGAICLGRDYDDSGSTSFSNVFWGALRAWPRMFFTRLFVQILIVLGLLLLVVPGVYFMFRSIFAEYFAVLEKSSPSQAIKRSFDISKGHEMKIIVYFFLTALISVLSMVIVSVPFVLVPELDNWVASAAMGLLFDLVEVYGILVFYCLYQKLSAVAQEVSDADAKSNAMLDSVTT